MQKEKILENYKESLKQKYNAVCFDIDGTLTQKNSNKIDERSIEMIANLLEKKIPIVFITGRGETGLNDLVDDIVLLLKEKYQISQKNLMRMYALVNDGARLFITTNESSGVLFDEKIYISTKEQLDELIVFNKEIINAMKSLSLSKMCKVTYSIDRENNIILNTRLVFKRKEEQVIDVIVDLINKIIKEKNMINLNVTRGFFKENAVIQIGTGKKEYAINKAEKIIGVPENSMIRIGDCGDIRGNDYSMLNCQQGYSVDKISGNENGCFPIFDENKNILNGVDATLHLIKTAKILPSICLEKANKYNYSKNYAQIEKKIVTEKIFYLQKYNDLINDIFQLQNGINDLFDSFSGSIKIPMYEWELIKDNNPLKELFNSKENKNLMYSLRDDNNYLLRGSKTYYYLIANRESLNNKDYTSKDNIVEFYSNNLDFFSRAIIAINNVDKLNELCNKKMILGILDNIRNYLLVSLNYKIIEKHENNNVLINLNNTDDLPIKRMYENLIAIDTIMADICFNKNYDINKTSIIKLINLIFNFTKNELIHFYETAHEKDYSKEFRAYREIDNFAENYITVSLSKDKNNNIHGVCGMCYGGIELPILYKIIEPNLTDVVLLKFNKLVSGYKNKQLVELRKFDIENYGGIINNGTLKNKDFIVLDDNLLTGKTMQLALNCLYDIGINIVNIGIVRYPSINRVDQMFLNNHGAVDYRLFFEYVTGLCFKSPYSWRDENKLDQYMDSLGVFDLNRKKLIECLIKNHDYSPKSEVCEYKRRILK